MRSVSTLVFLLWFVLSLIKSSSSAVIQSSQEAGDANNSQVNEAIKICREKLAIDPNFPRVQLSLAKLLDSKIDWTRPSKEEVVETIELYISVAKPHRATESSRLPPLSVQFDSLCRAAALCDEVLHDSSNAIRYYLEAIQMDNIDCDSTISIFATHTAKHKKIIGMASSTYGCGRKSNIRSQAQKPFSLPGEDSSGTAGSLSYIRCTFHA